MLSEIWLISASAKPLKFYEALALANFYIQYEYGKYRIEILRTETCFMQLYIVGIQMIVTREAFGASSTIRLTNNWR